jgi:hypothetical protein
LNLKPIIILGTPRSGTTYLGNLLKNHSELFYAEEYRFTWLYGNEGLSDMLRPIHVTNKNKAYIRKRFQDMVVASKKTRLLEKTPSNSLRPFFVKEIFPEAKFIYIQRDPLECILSIQDLWKRKADGITTVSKSNIYRRFKDLNLNQFRYLIPEMIKRVSPKFHSGRINNLWGPRIPGMSKILNNLGLLETCCIQWRFCTDELNYFYKSMPKDNILHCNLEELDARKIEQILDFCDLGHEGILDTFNKTFVKNPSGVRSKTLNDSEMKLINRWINHQ